MSDKPDLIATLRHYDVEVSDARREQVILCAVHDEDVPSMSVNIEKGLWHCFSCGQAGDSLTLIQIKENLSEFAAVVAHAEKVFGGKYGEVRKAAREQPGRAGISGQARPARGGYKPPLRRGI